jgi:hypothetical protein
MNLPVAEPIRAHRAGLLRLLGRLGPFAAVATVMVLFAVLAPDRFLSAYNLKTVAIQTVIVGLGAIGMTFVIVSGGIDLSVGSRGSSPARRDGRRRRDRRAGRGGQWSGDHPPAHRAVHRHPGQHGHRARHGQIPGRRAEDRRTRCRAVGLDGEDPGAGVAPAVAGCVAVACVRRADGAGTAPQRVPPPGYAGSGSSGPSSQSTRSQVVLRAWRGSFSSPGSRWATPRPRWGSSST